MKRFINYGSIKKLDHIVGDVYHETCYRGLDDNGDVIYEEARLPKILVTGTEKIHGTNASVCYSNPDGFWVQSRKCIVEIGADNGACAYEAQANIDGWMDIINSLASFYNIDLNEEVITVYYEHTGKNIARGSIFSGMEKRSIIFRYFKTSPIIPVYGNDGRELPNKILKTKTDQWVDSPDKSIYNIMNFKTYTVEIDFENLDESRAAIEKIAAEIEKKSNVAEYFKSKYTSGEGIVWDFKYKGKFFIFKTIGESHKKGTSNIRIPKPVDNVLENKKRNFAVNVACQIFRLEQMFSEISNSKYNGDIGKMGRNDIGSFIKLVLNDVQKEHHEELEKSKLTIKQLNPIISKISKDYFIDRLAEEQSTK